MVAKKRNTLRNKAAAAVASTRTSSGIEVEGFKKAEHNEDTTNPEAAAFLHQSRETKKSKQLNKQQSFLSQVRERSSKTDPAFAGISKSAVRRRKRNAREDLKPKMTDLLTSLGQEEDLKEHVVDQAEDNNQGSKRQITKIIQKEELPAMESGFVRIRKNEPNIRNQKGAKALTAKETLRMAEVLGNKSFQQNTFSALRDVIKMQNR